MKFLEKDLEDIIFETDNDMLEDRGLWIQGEKYRQVNMGGYGVADLITLRRPTYYPNHKKHDNPPHITIYELKKDLIDESCFFQALRYCKAVKSFFDKQNKGFNEFNYGCPNYHLGFTLDIVLIGRDVKLSESVCYLPDIFDNIQLYTYSYDVDGLSFKEQIGYELINEGF